MDAPKRMIELLQAELGPAAAEICCTDELDGYLDDFWRQYRGRCELVLRPRDTNEVATIARLASREHIPLVPQGGNTGLVRGGIPDQSGGQVVISLERMDRVRAIDSAGDYLVAEAGCVLADIQARAESAGRLFPLSLGSQGSCRIGGNISTNAGGVNVLRYGMTRQLVTGLEVVLADGRIWDGLSGLKKDNTGYDLKQLFIGAEGSLGIITAAVLRLFPLPRERQTVWLAIDQPAIAVDLLRRFQDCFGELISSFELLAGHGVEAAVTHLDGVRRPCEASSPWHLLIEVAWSLPDGLAAQMESMIEQVFEAGLARDGALAQSEAERANMWRIREGQSEATRHLGEIVRSDISVTIADLPELIARAQDHYGKTAPDITLLPFGHVGDGNLHFNFITNRNTPDREGLRKRLLDDLYALIGELGGSFSAEHGVGRLKRQSLVDHKPAVALDLMRSLKQSLDPHNILNPGVILE